MSRRIHHRDGRSKSNFAVTAISKLNVLPAKSGDESGKTSPLASNSNIFGFQLPSLVADESHQASPIEIAIDLADDVVLGELL